MGAICSPLIFLIRPVEFEEIVSIVSNKVPVFHLFFNVVRIISRKRLIAWGVYGKYFVLILLDVTF